MFFRVLLLGYFALGAAWGPAFCCCRVRSLVEYCTQFVPATGSVDSTRAIDATGGCPRCRAAAEKKQLELAGTSRCCDDSSRQSTPDSECPCKQRGETEFGLAGVLLPGFVDAFNSNQCPSDSTGYSLSCEFESATVFSSRFLPQDRCTSAEALFGRALLRAYQTLNC
jgi:hypothetical protein